MKDAVKLHRVS